MSRLLLGLALCAVAAGGVAGRVRAVIRVGEPGISTDRTFEELTTAVMLEQAPS